MRMRVDYSVRLETIGGPLPHDRPKTWDGSCPEGSVARWVVSALDEALALAAQGQQTRVTVTVTPEP